MPAPDPRTPLKWPVLLVVVLLSVAAGWFLRSGVAPSADGAPPAEGPATLPDRRAVDRSEVQPSAAVAAGIDAMSRNDLDEAKRILESVPPEDPSYDAALEYLGQVYTLLADPGAAVTTYEKLVGRSPESPLSHTLLGMAYYRAGRYRDAELAALRALEVDPGFLHARYNVGLYRLVQGDVAGATRAYIRAMQMDSSATVYSDALQELEQLHERDPDLAGAHYALALFAHSIDQSELEIIELEHFLARVPEGPLAQRARAMLADARKR